MDHRQLKAFARRAGRARGRERERLVKTLLEALPELDPFEGYDEFTVWLARTLARVKWSIAEQWD